MISRTTTRTVIRSILTITKPADACRLIYLLPLPLGSVPVLGVYFTDWQDEFSSSRTSISGVSSLSFSIICAATPIGTLIARKFSCRTAIVAGKALLNCVMWPLLIGCGTGRWGNRFWVNGKALQVRRFSIG